MIENKADARKLLLEEWRPKITAALEGLGLGAGPSEIFDGGAKVGMIVTFKTNLELNPDLDEFFAS
jgi:hypothetical protein